MHLSQVPQVHAGLNMITAGILKTQGRYLNEFFGMTCAPDLLKAKLFPNGKEMTESMAAFAAVRNRLPHFKLSDPDVHVFCVGDGHVPRTGALFAYRSRWKVFSIDPAMRVNKALDIARLTRVPTKVEDFHMECEKAIIVGVHSHAPLQACLNSIKAKQLAVVAIPCCVSLNLRKIPPDMEYQDLGIWSPQNTVKIWSHLSNKE